MSALAVHDALLARLSPAVAPVPVRSEMPRNQAYPLVHIGRITGQPVNTLDARYTQLLVTITVWSVHQGAKEIAQLVQAIETALDDAPLTLATGDAVRCHVDRWDITDADDEGEARVRTGSLIVNVLLEH